MAKLTLDTITSSFASTTLFNTNFATILAELDGKVLYRNNTSGEANQMENDLDMNSNSILNANAINVTTLTVNGTPLTASTATTTTASAVTYDDSASVHTAVDVQEALDELGNASLATVQTSATDATAARLMAVGAFGLGATTAPVLADLKSLVAGGLYSVGGGALNLPPNMSNGTAYVGKWTTGGASESQSVLAIDVSNDAIWLTNYDGYDGQTWSAWQRIDPQGFGIGTDTATVITDADALRISGKYRTGSTWTGSVFPGTVGENQGTLEHNAYSAQYGTQVYKDINTEEGTWTRQLDNGTWSTWQPVYTGANLNPNVFGGVGASDYIAVGWAQSATSARFILPTSGLTSPSSISIASTFSVLKGPSIVGGGGGISSFTMSSPSNKATVIEATGLSGLVVGEILQLYSDTAASKITVDF